MNHTFRAVLAVLVAATLAAACGGAGDDPTATPGIRILSPADSAALLDAPPDDLVIIDVRTLEEFEEGHIAGAEMLDFRSDDFSTRLAELDRDQPYVIYCRSGNRSGQTRAMMDDLGFTDVVDISGGTLAWADAGLDLVTR